ncbi:ABC transporter ATP-binding protein [Acetobacter sp. AN02]|uniref:ABC transporter ATP-binding protein n=1 Tax=Acetobacter sp. AN02 TaxID=2894186 RepID=UPI00243459BD|nr:ABC transporter ATP-binding protein [Acetobacter sp. AN02]
MNTYSGPMLEFLEARPSFEDSGLPPVPFSARVMPGDCIIVECRDAERAAMFADMCSGMVSLQSGAIRFMGLDWSELRYRQMNALRGRIGRMVGTQCWSDRYGAHYSMMLKVIYHTGRSMEEVTDEAIRLSERFGLPGLPVSLPSQMSSADKVRASCVRAFIGKPHLVLISDPLAKGEADLAAPLISSIVEAMDRGAAVLWFVRNLSARTDYSQVKTGLWHLTDEGLSSGRSS